MNLRLAPTDTVGDDTAGLVSLALEKSTENEGEQKGMDAGRITAPRMSSSLVLNRRWKTTGHICGIVESPQVLAMRGCVSNELPELSTARETGDTSVPDGFTAWNRMSRS